uniref:Cytochrome b6-f complex subunit 6 n=1 Tax=Jenufa minuta TaxID=993092 RepID=A0A0S2LNA3_JENMI|nr:subunit VI of cytochrome b6/f complex [Jenufa minuta]ALO62949.1 subunit VI of cytochrome b6/f complex [Jenufa minuta]
MVTITSYIVLLIGALVFTLSIYFSLLKVFKLI